MSRPPALSSPIWEDPKAKDRSPAPFSSNHRIASYALLPNDVCHVILDGEKEEEGILITPGTSGGGTN